MKISKLKLQNYRGVENIEFRFHEKMNVFVGINGAGKSSVLDALALALSWLVNRIPNSRAKGQQWPIQDLRNGAEKGQLTITLEYLEKQYPWFLTQAALGEEKETSSYEGASKLAELLRQKYKEQQSLPVIAYYRVDRNVKQAKPDTSNRNLISDFDVYNQALSGSTNYQDFFEWFRQQDDILNEKARSRTDWLKKNKAQTAQDFKHIFNTYKHIVRYYNNDNPTKLLNVHQLLSQLVEFLNDKNPQQILIDIYFIIKELEQIKFYSKKPAIIYQELLSNIKYIFYKMSSLSNDSLDNLMDNNQGFLDLISKITNNFDKIISFKDIYKLSHISSTDIDKIDQWGRFFWQIFAYGLKMSLWWFGNNGSSQLRDLLTQSPFRYSQEAGKTFSADNFIRTLEGIVHAEIKIFKKMRQEYGLRFARQALATLLPEYQNLEVKRHPRPRMEISKDGKTFNLDQLSDGEKNLIALIGDIARRLSMANPGLENPLEGKGIILIDEIDLHLHPQWQHLVASKLPEIFSNCQFFLTTHSPPIISHIKAESIIILKNSEGKITQHSVQESYGKNADRILEDLMDTDARPPQIEKQLHEIFESIQKGEIEQAKLQIEALRKEIGEDGELIRAGVLIQRRELIGK